MQNKDGMVAELMLKTHKLECRDEAEGNLERMTEENKGKERRSSANVHVSHFCAINSTLP